MKYASVCDGIGAAHAAWQPLGWQCMWTSEIEPFPSAVVEQRWGFENRGDMTKHKEWTVDEGSSIDLLVGGTPCQSFSVAGLRQGLKDPRGNLMLTYLAIAERLKPRWIVWENVPGVLSSNGGRDFGSFLGALGDLGFGWAYRVLDAQWFGVAQRRRRVFVVGCFGDATSAAKVLFESESVQRNPAPCRTPREKTSGPIAGCSNGGGANGPGRTADDADSLVVAHVPVMVMAHGQANAEICKGYSPTLSCAHEVPIAFHPTQDPISSQDGVVHALGTGLSGGSRRMQGVMPAVAHTVAMAVRRLTPRECERLQGFPDDYTAITYFKKPAADGPRYKSLGNSMAVPCMRWIGERIEAVGRRGSGG